MNEIVMTNKEHEALKRGKGFLVTKRRPWMYEGMYVDVNPASFDELGYIGIITEMSETEAVVEVM